MEDWAGFLAFAAQLAERESEAEHRSAISRAYYAAYNDARRYVRRKEPTYSFNDGDHRKVWDWFGNAAGPARSLVTTGTTLRRKRNAADYDVYATPLNLKYEAGDAVAKATRILTILEQTRQADTGAKS